MGIKAIGRKELQHQLGTKLAEGERNVEENYGVKNKKRKSPCCPVQNAFLETKHFFIRYSYIEEENDD